LDNSISLTIGCSVQAFQYSETEEEVMMRRIMSSIFVLALAVLTFTHLTAADEMTIKANLTGAAEVPGPGDPNGSGTVQVTLNTDKNEVCYDLTLTKVDGATAAHIREGTVGKAGPAKVIFNVPPGGGSTTGCKTADAAVVKDIMANPANYYLNVHSTAHPNGAVRGQLAK
jgi:CHRD domain